MRASFGGVSLSIVCLAGGCVVGYTLAAPSATANTFGQAGGCCPFADSRAHGFNYATTSSSVNSALFWARTTVDAQTDLVVQVDRVLAGELNGESPPGHARVTYLQPQPMSLDELRSALVTKQSVIFFVSNKGEFYQESGLPFQSLEEEEYFRSVLTLRGDLAFFVNVMGAATAPLVPPELASRLLSPIAKDDGGAPSYKELVAYIEGGT